MNRIALRQSPFNPIRGRRPAPMNCTVGELSVDPSYQRSIDNPSSRALIKKIAREWDWSLFQLLVVSRRPTGELYVVDGQHRLEAARLRGDLHDLPCSVYDFQFVAHEADAFVALNQQRKPLTRLDLFKGAVTGGGGCDCQPRPVADFQRRTDARPAHQLRQLQTRPGRGDRRHLQGVQNGRA